jgi:GNAT superfamily N-acetyltransferase
MNLPDATIALRHDLRPGDLGRVIEQHGVLYAAEYGFDHTFEAYVAGTLAELGGTAPPGPGRLWLAERDGALLGSIGIVGREDGAAQLRWLLLHPDARGRGLGRRLVDEALAYCRDSGYRSVYLWTVHVLTDAARLYVAAGFRKTDAKPMGQLWSVMLAEERYDLVLGRPLATANLR